MMAIDNTALDSQTRAVTDYYRYVDSGDVGALVSLFTDEAVYYRPGYPPLQGHADLRRFYTEDREIEAGHHKIARIVGADPHVAVYGHFTGVLKNGTAVAVGFADFFSFATDGRFAERRTFFETPAV
ncbi:MAG TPA: nuclear transport factor 2 family protein [Jiangellales bacterium]|nr:nuclear transport factor 2 family protein [Jiangellales bacterium]